jgi:hypothetical protein
VLNLLKGVDDYGVGSINERVVEAALRGALVVIGSPSRPELSALLRSEAAAIFCRDYERLDHLRIDEVPIELIQFRQPELEAGVVRTLRVVRVTSQVICA